MGRDPSRANHTHWTDELKTGVRMGLSIPRLLGNAVPAPSSPNPTLGIDQRRHPRVMTSRPLKLFHRASGRFLPAQACDLSDGGALIAISWPVRMLVGEELDVYLPPDRHVMLSSKHRALARVVRVLAGAQTCMIAVRFDALLSETILKDEAASGGHLAKFAA